MQVFIFFDVNFHEYFIVFAEREFEARLQAERYIEDNCDPVESELELLSCGKDISPGRVIHLG